MSPDHGLPDYAPGERRLPPDHATAVLDPQADSRRLIAEFRAAILAGKYWYLALLETIGQWRLPSEEIAGREYHYLIADEAFDWLVLAERLIEPIADLIPESDRINLLFYGAPPVDLSEEDFKNLIGPTKYRAHLNFVYGVLLEEALLIAVQREIEKENRSRAYREDRRTAETLYQRLYGQSLDQLRLAFHTSRLQPDRESITQAEWKEFTYWLFKRRLRYWDKARIASDTRKAIRSLERLRNERLHHLGLPLTATPEMTEFETTDPSALSDSFGSANSDGFLDPGD